MIESAEFQNLVTKVLAVIQQYHFLKIAKNDENFNENAKGLILTPNEFKKKFGLNDADFSTLFDKDFIQFLHDSYTGEIITLEELTDDEYLFLSEIYAQYFEALELESDLNKINAFIEGHVLQDTQAHNIFFFLKNNGQDLNEDDLFKNDFNTDLFKSTSDILTSLMLKEDDIKYFFENIAEQVTSLDEVLEENLPENYYGILKNLELFFQDADFLYPEYLDDNDDNFQENLTEIDVIDLPLMNPLYEKEETLLQKKVSYILSFMEQKGLNKIHPDNKKIFYSDDNLIKSLNEFKNTLMLTDDDLEIIEKISQEILLDPELLKNIPDEYLIILKNIADYLEEQCPYEKISQEVHGNIMRVRYQQRIFKEIIDDSKMKEMAYDLSEFITENGLEQTGADQLSFYFVNGDFGGNKKNPNKNFKSTEEIKTYLMLESLEPLFRIIQKFLKYNKELKPFLETKHYNFLSHMTHFYIYNCLPQNQEIVER